MSIDVGTVKKLATLARLEVTDEEVQKLAGELGSILDYISQIDKALTTEEIKVSHPVKNALRQDVVTNPTGSYTDDLLALSPLREGNYVKVKKIL